MCDEHGTGCASRRAVLAGAGGVGVTALLAGCQTYGVVGSPYAPAGPLPARPQDRLAGRPPDGDLGG
ncbi:Rieske (2Fe-2S) protein, partial [Micromonospora wenchangensis]